MRWPRAGVAKGDPNPAASMALLDEVLDPPVGPGYYSAAQARVAEGRPASTGYNTPVVFVAALLGGLLITTAAVTLRAPDPAAAEARAQVIERIEDLQETGDREREHVEQLRGEILALEQDRALAEAGPDAGREIAATGMQAGAQAVAGPGAVIVLEDATAEGGPGEKRPERVNARDIQLVVNGLWSAGAEAISVNGHRLTSTSAIRFAGEAIIVDFRSLAPPYEVRAIGDPDQLAQETSTGLTGAYLGELRSQLGIRSSVTMEQQITIGPAERLTTRVGSVVDDSTEERR